MTTFHEFSAKLERLEREWSGVEGRRRLERVAQKTKGDVGEAVRGDLGDLSMSGWRRGKPIDVQGRYDVVTDSSFTVTPAKRGRGPMRVLEQGRNQGNASGFSGPGVNAKTGATSRNLDGSLRKVRARKGKRWNGRTAGKGTWGDATTLMRARVAGRVHDELVKSMREVF